MTEDRRMCGVCGRTQNLPDDLSFIGELYCTKHDPKVQMLKEEQIDETYLTYLEKRYGHSINPEEIKSD